ncbi:MAG: hypothetical protein IPI11_02290 [Haliscomenobacter sp.]|nr:hypothetical protein [Haliscomenobacter sp.]
MIELGESRHYDVSGHPVDLEVIANSILTGTLPGDVDDTSEEHTFAVEFVINAAIQRSHEYFQSTGEEFTEWQVLDFAGRLVTFPRGMISEELSQNITLRDAQHYFHGRLATYRSHIPSITAILEGLVDEGDPVNTAIIGAIQREFDEIEPLSTGTYSIAISPTITESLLGDIASLVYDIKKYLLGTGVQATEFSPSPTGGRDWAERGSADYRRYDYEPFTEPEDVNVMPHLVE